MFVSFFPMSVVRRAAAIIVSELQFHLTSCSQKKNLIRSTCQPIRFGASRFHTRSIHSSARRCSPFAMPNLRSALIQRCPGLHEQVKWIQDGVRRAMALFGMGAISISFKNVGSQFARARTDCLSRNLMYDRSGGCAQRESVKQL